MLGDNYSKAYKSVMNYNKSISKPINQEKDFNGGYSKDGVYYKPKALSKDQQKSQTKANYSLSGNYTDKNGNMWYSETKQAWQQRDNGEKGIEDREGIFKLLNKIK